MFIIRPRPTIKSFSKKICLQEIYILYLRTYKGILHAGCMQKLSLLTIGIVPLHLEFSHLVLTFPRITTTRNLRENSRCTLCDIKCAS